MRIAVAIIIGIMVLAIEGLLFYGFACLMAWSDWFKPAGGRRAAWKPAVFAASCGICATAGVFEFVDVITDFKVRALLVGLFWTIMCTNSFVQLIAQVQR